MEITLYIAAYIASIFINRFFNWIAFKSNPDVAILPGIWFIPIIPTIILIILILFFKFDSECNDNWFTGKYWRD